MLPAEKFAEVRHEEAAPVIEESAPVDEEEHVAAAETVEGPGADVRTNGRERGGERGRGKSRIWTR